VAKNSPTVRDPRRRARTERDTEVVPNQVFIGAPWSSVRPKYERIANSLRKKYPLSFVIVGRTTAQDAEDLLQVIRSAIESSSYAIFDATSGNANVSLEFGYAEAKGIPRALYLSTHAAARKVKDTAIIADLAGKVRNLYAQEPALEKLLGNFAKDHVYTKRFDRFIAQRFKRLKKGSRRRPRSLALKILHCLDGKRDARRDDVVQAVLAGAGSYSRDEVDGMIRKLHSADLIRSVQGPHSTVRIV
jgi:hypothetical protein